MSDDQYTEDSEYAVHTYGQKLLSSLDRMTDICQVFLPIKVEAELEKLMLLEIKGLRLVVQSSNIVAELTLQKNKLKLKASKRRNSKGQAHVKLAGPFKNKRNNDEEK